jgi:hypothetical protein
LILSSLGTIFLIVVVVGVFLAYVKPVQYMGYPPVVPIDTTTMIANVVLVALSVGFAVHAIIARRAEYIIAPNRSLPPTLNSTSSVRDSEEF